MANLGLSTVLLFSFLCLAVFADDAPLAGPGSPRMGGVPVQRPGRSKEGVWRGWYGGGRGGRGKGKCRDKKPQDFCNGVLSSGKCDKGKHAKRCRKTCGKCVEKGCQDTSYNCRYDRFKCTQHWYAVGCKMSCGLCPTGSTTTRRPRSTTPISTTEETQGGCYDTEVLDCKSADKFRCSFNWFSHWCRLSCGICQTEEVTTTSTTTPISTTTTVTTTTTTEETTPRGEETTSFPECTDAGRFCEKGSEFRCGLEWFASNCRKSCGLCETDEVTTPEVTELPVMTGEPDPNCMDTGKFCQRGSEFRCGLDWFASNCRRACGLCKTGEVTTTEATELPTSNQPIPSCVNDRADCESFFSWFCEIPSILLECRKFCGACVEETTTVETTEISTKKKCWKTTGSTMTTSTERKPFPTSSTTPTTITEDTSAGPEECTDQSTMCKTWKDSGLCFNEEFKESMEALCPASCNLCI